MDPRRGGDEFKWSFDMTFLDPLRHPLTASIALSLALALAGCVVPKVLGPNDTDADTESTTESQANTESATDTQADTDTSTTDTDGPLLCEAGQGGGPGGASTWALAGDELPAIASAVAVDPSDRIVLAGTVAPPGEDRDVRIEVRAADGASTWLRSYAGEKGLDDQALDVAVDSAGNVLVLVRETIVSIVGEMTETHDARLVVLRLDPDGAQIWRWEQEHPAVAMGSVYEPAGALAIVGDAPRVLVRAHDEPTLVIGLDDLGDAVSSVALAAPAGLDVERQAIAADGSVFIAGDLEFGLSEHDLWIGRFAEDGVLLWSDQFGGLDDSPTALIPDGEGGVLLAWSTSLPGGIENHLRRHDAAGVTLWSESVPLSGLDAGIADGVIRCDGVLLLTGASEKEPAPASTWGFRRELWVAAYALDGTALWSTFHAFGEVESAGEGQGVAALASGDAVVTG
ncbi:MAG TPA: hypothetical protein PKW35_25625, partial [Nannocystaceae bacterium]|nr:hypothetical protein [Nannocystaceae bacterium]